MGAFRNNQRPAPNPYNNDANPPGFWGLSGIGGMTCAQGGNNEFGDPDSENYETVLTQVIDWPFAEDDAGVAFDQANLYGVRTRCWRLAGVDGGGDRDSWTAVPKTLPAEYTAVGRCGIQPVYGDYLGASPLTYPVAWNHRTPTSGYLLDVGTAEGSARSYWTPRSYNQEVITMQTVSGFTSGTGSVTDAYRRIVPPGTYPADYYIVDTLDLNSPGFRGGSLELIPINPNYPAAYTGSTTLVFAYMDLNEVQDDPWIEDHPPATLVTVGTITITESWALNDPATAPTQTISLPAFDFGQNGKAKAFYIYHGPYNEAGGYSLLTSVPTFSLSPRTDIPLWYFASTRNKVAPGGIIQP